MPSSKHDSSPQKHIAIIPGDGVGIEVTAEAIRLLETRIAARHLPLEFVILDWGADKYVRDGVSLPPGALEWLRSDFDAIFIGALGDPRIPSNQHAADILLGIRFGLDLYVNQRPVKLLDARFCPLKGRQERDVNLVIVRENTEGLYAGIGGNLKRDTPDEIAVQEDVNTRKGVERILVYAFDYARRHGLRKVCMSDKANALRFAHGLWERTFAEVRRRYPEVEASHLYIDTLAMEMVRDPSQFELIVTSNMFGDIISDLGAQLQGGLGLAPSANINPGQISMFETVHGSAPDIAGRNLANPFAAFLTIGLMLEYVGFSSEKDVIENAVSDALRQNRTTRDLEGLLSTREAADFVISRLSR